MNETEKTIKPFMTINAAAEYTGLARSYIRAGCISGNIPHVKCGSKYMVNVVALLKSLGAEMEVNE